MHRAFVSWLAESDGKPVFTQAVLTGSCDVCKAVLTLALSLPPSHLLCPYIAHCLMTGPTLPRKLTAHGRAETFHVKVVKVADLLQNPAQNILERPCTALLLRCTVVWARLSCKSFCCLTKASFSIKSEKVLIFFIKKSSFTFRQ